jgi:Flp pilus assembly secretin CpaC
MRAMTRSLRKLVLGAMLAAITGSSAVAQERAVALGIGISSRLFLENAFETVIVGDPLIVDISTDDNQSVLIKPLRAGVTNLVFVDAHGMVTANITVSVCEASSKSACGARQSSL